jgi:hypothetical protein
MILLPITVRNKIATFTGDVLGITEDGLVQVQFDGASEASGKGYPSLLVGSGPAVGDRVACIRTRGSYIVLGAYGGVEV